MTELSHDQTHALEHLAEFIEKPRDARQYRTLHGLAGTGKTFLLAELTKRYPGLTLTAFTGKAASVLRRRVNVNVSTLHSVIYNFQGLANDEFDPDKKNPIFTPKGDPLPERVILVDEVSMVGARIAQDLLDTGARVIACGDPGQLPPVRDKQYFTRPDFTLTKVHRQALGSPIIRQAHHVRNENRYEADGEAFRVISRAEPKDLLGHEMILCWRNATRRRLNTRKRQLLGFGPNITPGEPIMCLQNDHQLGVYNGAIYSVVSWEEPELYLQDDLGRSITIPAATIEDIDPEFEIRRYDEDSLPFAMAYAATVHKSQGSEYTSVLLFDESDDSWAQFMYTGITRAVERCTVVRWRS